MNAPHMNPAEFREALARLDMAPAEFARMIGSNERNMRKAAEDGSDGPGPAASFALRCLLAFKDIRMLAIEAEEAAESGECVRDDLDEIRGFAECAIRGEFLEPRHD